MQDFETLAVRLNKRRDKIADTEIALENIKQVLLAGFGVKIAKRQPTPKDVSKLLSAPDLQRSFNSLPTITTAAKEAWLKADMPEPNKFFADYRKNHGD